MTLLAARAPSEPGSAGPGAEDLTLDRNETKYLVPLGVLAPFTAEVTRHLPLHRFAGEGANRLPDPQHFVTTVYFDTPSLRHFEAARRHGENDTKIRAKTYYDLHPSLVEVATDAAHIVHAPDIAWFEIKKRSGTQTSKKRFRLRRADVPAFFEEGRLAPASAALAPPASVEGVARAEALALCQGLGEPLLATSVVNYQRVSRQDSQGRLRVTVDLGLSYYSVPPDLWTGSHALERRALGVAKAREARAVLEIKLGAASPLWLTEALSRAGLSPVAFSKFVASMEAVLGR